jgi:hypothetical protein
VAVWAWVLFLVVTATVAVLVIRWSRDAREDPFADVPRADGTAPPPDGGPTATTEPAATASPEPTIGAARRSSLEERLRAARAAHPRPVERGSTPVPVRAATGTTATSTERAPSRTRPASTAPPAATFEILPLDPASRSRYRERWDEISARARTDASGAIVEADALARSVLVERGFPTDIDDPSITEASIAYPDVIDPYRLARSVATDVELGRATPDAVRRALVHAGDVIDRLVLDDLSAGEPDSEEPGAAEPGAEEPDPEEPDSGEQAPRADGAGG